MLKIINNTNLEYATIGMIIDNIRKMVDTHYYGKIEWTTVEVGSHQVRVQIRYLKKYVEWRFEYVK